MDHGTYIILGATSAIAMATARRLASKGAKLALVARNAEKLATLSDDLNVRGAKEVQVICTDLSQSINPKALYDSVDKELGAISGILVFYGILGDQARATGDIEHALEIIDVNYRSAAAWVMQGALVLENSSSSNRVMIGISSVAADRGRRSNYLYGSAKAGLSVLIQGLAHQWAEKRDQPRAVCFKLGFVDTPMTDDFDKSGPLWAKPDKVAEKIEKAIQRGNPIIYTPWFWRWIMLAIRTTPTIVFNRVNL